MDSSTSLRQAGAQRRPAIFLAPAKDFCFGQIRGKTNIQLNSSGSQLCVVDKARTARPSAAPAL